MPISCLLPISMPYISRTNPIFCTKQAQILCHPLFTKYDVQQHTTTATRLLRSVQKPCLHVTSYINLKPDCFELKNKNNKDGDHVHVLLRTVSDFMETQKKKLPAVVIGAISVCYSYKALAASGGGGGIMGGDSFSSYSSSSDSSWSSSSSSDDDSSWSSSSSSPSSSYSYSSPSSSSSLDDSSWSSSSWSLSSDTDYESKTSRPYRSTSQTYESRSSSKPSGSTYSESAETSKYTTSTSVAPEITSTKIETSSTEGLGILIVVVSILGIALFCAMRKDTPPQNDIRVIHEYMPQKTRVVKFQVALLGSARSFQSDINEIAKVADTSTRRGFKNILTESLALTRHSAYWESSHLSVYKEQCVKDGEKCFSGISFEERSKFDQETLVNLGNFKRKGKLRQQFDDPSHDYIVVTFIVAVLGILELPTPKSRSDLIAIVQKLRSIHEKDILAVQVLWTPQDENDTLSSERVFKDYPFLQPL